MYHVRRRLREGSLACGDGDGDGNAVTMDAIWVLLLFLVSFKAAGLENVFD